MTAVPPALLPVRDRTPVLLFGIVLAAGVVLACIALAVHPYFFQFYGDANSRLVQTRMIVDSTNPGLHWIGSVWLPLPQLLFLPFSLVGALFSTGLAGFVVCMPLLAWSAALLYKLALRITGDSAVSALAALFFALNPNTLYVSMTAMTETVTLFFFIAALWHWTAWISAPTDDTVNPRLLLGSLAAAAATLCRYEAWLFTAVGAAGIALIILFSRRALSRKAALLGMLLSSFLGIALWLLWNRTQFGDAFYFNHAEYYSAAWQARHRPVRDSYYLQAWNSIGIYATTTLAIYGPVFLLAATAGTAVLFRRRPRRETLFLLATLLVMPFFTLLSLYLGIAEMTQWWNSRYVLLLAPFVALATAIAFARWKSAARSPRLVHGVMATAFILTTAFQIGLQKGQVVTIADAAGGFYYMQTPYATEVGELLRREYREGMVLCATGSGQSHRIIQPSGIATKRFVTGLNHDRRLLDPAVLRADFSWVIVGLEASPDGAVIATRWIADRAILERDFDPVFRNAYFIVYRRRG